MALRLSSELWVQAYLRQCRLEGAFGYLASRGSEAAGAIFVKIVQQDGKVDLYGPAPQSLMTEEALHQDSRLFELLQSGGEAEIDTKLSREQEFDPDIWIIEIEDATGIHRLPLSPT
ncbi:MAG: DUF1491 family protein [Hyphomicrobiales bacterium]